MRTRNINMNQEITNATKNFLSNYLAKKYKVENDIYLSFYVSEDDNDDLQISRSVRFTNILRKIELTLESQLYPKLAKIFIDQFIKLDPVEIIRSNKMSVGFFISESFSGFIFIPFPVCETIVVARSLHLKPILSWLKSGDQFYTERI